MIRDRVLFAAAVLAVWCSVGPARLIASALRGADALSSFVMLAFGGVLLGLGWFLAQEEEAPSLPVLLATGLAAALLFSQWELPEERFHLVLYPPLGWLAWRAAGEGRARSAVAIGLVLVAGVGDEGLQGMHPERQFDWMDLLANGLGGSIVPLLALGGWAAWASPVVLVTVALLFAPIQRAIGVAPPPRTGGSQDGPPAEVPVYAPAAQERVEVQRVEGIYADHNVVLITIDALRADHVPPHGRAPVPTPAMDALAAESLALAGVAAGTWTSPSMVSTLSALHPAVHGVDGRGLDIAPSLVLPLEQLADAGWVVVGHAGDDTENYRHLGITTELDRSDEATALGHALVTNEAPVFAWVHLRDVHAPYDATPERLLELGLPSEIPSAPILDRARSHYTVPRAAFPGRHDWLKPIVRALYAAEVADADAALGRVMSAIEASGELGRTLVVLTADHGEELLENDGIGHASTTLDSVPRPVLQDIPMLIRLPDGARAGQRSSSSLRQQDLLPTLLPLLGVAVTLPSADPTLVGVDRSDAVLLESPEAGSAPTTWFVSSPCGWQCPPPRRAERVAAVQGDRWEWCRYGADQEEPACDGTLEPLLRRARALAKALQTPVPAE